MNTHLKKISLAATIVLALYSAPCACAKEKFPNLTTLNNTRERHIIPSQKNAPKDWTFMVYMAADNDLRNFSIHNIKQLAAVGSNQYINIIVHLDIRITGNQKITRVYYIEADKISEVEQAYSFDGAFDSGDPETLISFCNWGINAYPARQYALILWNHGTGAIDPCSKHISPSRLFSFNAQQNKFELNRSVGFLDILGVDDSYHRGICWDSSTGNYLDNHKLEYALQQICAESLGGQKIDIIGFDACLMSMVEIGSIIKNYGHIMIGSQEVVLGTGLNYELALSPFLSHSPSRIEFAQHIVESYARTYEKITNDFTLSAIALDTIDELEESINTISQLLKHSLNTHKLSQTLDAIWKSHNKKFCTHFDEPSYIDAHHFFENLKKNSDQINLSKDMKKEFLAELTKAQKLIGSMVIANQVGTNLRNAKGISIYFPEKKVYPSYPESYFGKNNEWASFLNHYHRAKQQGSRLPTIDIDQYLVLQNQAQQALQLNG